MKIINRAAFLALPAGTVYAKYAPCYMEELAIKGETWSNDFQVQDIADAIECTGSSDFSDKLIESQECGTSLSMDFNCMGRDGCFDEGQLFAVFERCDVIALIWRLEMALEVSR